MAHLVTLEAEKVPESRKQYLQCLGSLLFSSVTTGIELTRFCIYSSNICTYSCVLSKAHAHASFMK